MSLFQVNAIPLYGMIVGLIPAYLYLVFLTNPYEKDLDEQKLWRGLFFGLFGFGVVAYFIEAVGFASFAIRTDEEFVVADFIKAFVSIFTLAILHPVMMGMWLNKKANQGERQTIVLAAGLGFGFGAMYGLMLFAGAVLLEEVSTLYEGFLNFLVIQGLIFILGATAVILAYGVLENQYIKYMKYCVLINIIPNIVKVLRALALIPHEALAVFMVIYGLALFQVIRKEYMPFLSSITPRQRKVKQKLIIKKALE